MNIYALPEASYRFRAELLDLLDRFTPIERFIYVDSDTVVMVCPQCGCALTVRFAGMAARADLECHRGCAESEILAALKGQAAK